MALSCLKIWGLPGPHPNILSLGFRELPTLLGQMTLSRRVCRQRLTIVVAVAGPEQLMCPWWQSRTHLAVVLGCTWQWPAHSALYNSATPGENPAPLPPWEVPGGCFLLPSPRSSPPRPEGGPGPPPTPAPLSPPPNCHCILLPSLTYRDPAPG